MTDRKPRHVSWESWVDQQLRQAKESGLLDDLPGEGKPLPDLGEAEDPLWWAKKLVRREGIDVLPPALEIRRKVERAMSQLGSARREADVRILVGELNREIRQLNRLAAKGPPTRQAPLDEEEVVERWRREQSLTDVGKDGGND